MNYAKAAESGPPEADSIIRAATFALELRDRCGSPLDKNGVWKRLHEAWSLCQRAANAVQRTLLAGDAAEIETTARGKRRLRKLPGSLSTVAYHQARSAASGLSSSPVSDIAQRVWKKYEHDRWAIQVAGAKSATTFRRPCPLPIRRQDWNLLTGQDEKGRTTYLVQFPLMDRLRNERPIFRLILRTARDADLLRKIAAGEYDRRTIEILPPGWNRRGAVKIKLVYQRPKPTLKDADGTLTVTTGNEPFLTASRNVKEERPFSWHAEELRVKIAKYKVWRQKLAENTKHERRVPAGRREFMSNTYEKRARVFQDRLRTTLSQFASQVTGRAARCRCRSILFDDRDRSFSDQFPWHQLRGELLRAAENQGLEVIFKDNGEEKNDGEKSESTATARPTNRATGHRAGTAGDKPRRGESRAKRKRDV